MKLKGTRLSISRPTPSSVPILSETPRVVLGRIVVRFSRKFLLVVSTLVSFLMAPIILVAVVFLVGEFDAVDITRQPAIHEFASARKAIRNLCLVPETCLKEIRHSEDGANMNAWDVTIALGNCCISGIDV